MGDTITPDDVELRRRNPAGMAAGAIFAGLTVWAMGVIARLAVAVPAVPNA